MTETTAITDAIIGKAGNEVKVAYVSGNSLCTVDQSQNKSVVAQGEKYTGLSFAELNNENDLVWCSAGEN